MQEIIILECIALALTLTPYSCSSLVGKSGIYEIRKDT